MLTVSNDKTQFGAYYMGPARIKGKIRHRWRDVDAHMIKFQTNLGSELNSIEAVKYLWCGKNLSEAVTEEARRLGAASNVYALTSQETNFERIDPTKILGLMTTGKIQKGEPTVEIFKIGANPKYAFAQNKKGRDVKHIATAMVEIFNKKAAKKGIKAVVNNTNPDVEPFLDKLGLL
jgi:hypothetical protein